MNDKKKTTAAAGNRGERVRSDCYVELELTQSGGIQIELNSKVKALFGKQQEDLARQILDFFEIEHARLSIEDSGALPFVLAARIESAVNQLVETDKEFRLDLLEENRYESSRERFRFSRLYLPGNNPKMMLNAGIHNPHGIILDLEDSVSPDKKAEARFLVRNALCQVNFYGAERMVRINQLPGGLHDLPYIVPHNVHLILIPKCESASQIKQVEHEIEQIKKDQHIVGVKHSILFMPIIESALGVEKAFEIATASPNVVALAIGLEDFTADLGVVRTAEGNESLYARMRIVNASKAARIQPIDSVFSDVSDMEALAETVRKSKALGFEGMGCIHPRQIQVIHENFAPETAEIEKAKKIVDAYNHAVAKGLGVVALGSKMIDAPVVKRAQKIIQLAEKLGLSE